MDVRVSAKKLCGELDAISSKSYAHRILLAASLCEDETNIHLNIFSNDILASIDTVKALGSDVIITKTGVRVIPNKIPQNANVFCHESGTTARLVLPIMAAVCESGTLSGSGSLPTRPFDDLCKAMEDNGTSFNQYNLPISFTSKLKSGTYNITGGKSSQYISGLMFALPLLDGDSKINLTAPLQSTGYVDITLAVLKQFGIESGYDIKGNQKFISPGEISVEGDWSNASYWLATKLKLNGLNNDSLQLDKLFPIVCDSDEIDAMEIPDLVPALAIYATQKENATKIYNIERLRIKESDRVLSVTNMIKSLGGIIEVEQNHMIITPSSLTSGTVDGYNDHRIVMSATIASLFCDGSVTITGAEAVNKSYPSFFEHFKELGGTVDVL